MTELAKSQGTVMVYGCGGTGIKRAFFSSTAESIVGHADVKTCYIDTSDSDIDPAISPKDCLIIPETEGSGSVRGTNPQIIKSYIAQIPVTFKPGDVNIVICGGLGGSGGVIAPLLMEELINRGEAVIAIVVVGSVSDKATSNSISTLLSIANLSVRATTPFVVMVEDNLHNDPAAMNQADLNIAFNISAMRLLAHKNHIGLDREDVRNFLRFHQFTTVPAQIATLSIAVNKEELDGISYPVAVASINKGATMLGSLGAEYYCGGTLRDTSVIDCEEVMYVISVTELPAVMKSLESRLAAIRERAASRPRVAAMGTNVGADADGMIY